MFEEIEPDESRSHDCERLGPAVDVRAVTLYKMGEAGSAGQGPGVGVDLTQTTGRFTPLAPARRPSRVAW